MKCFACSAGIHESWSGSYIFHKDQYVSNWRYRIMQCPECGTYLLQLSLTQADTDWSTVYPRGAKRGPVPPEVPAVVAQDYIEACNVISISPKASAALSRRCLQMILRSHGYKDRDLAKEIDLLLSEADPAKAIPGSLRITVDAIRNFGNFSAHPITDQTTLQIIDVEPEEAEWCLEIIEEMFQHFYVRPAEAAARKAALDAKLAQAGKPASK